MSQPARIRSLALAAVLLLALPAAAQGANGGASAGGAGAPQETAHASGGAAPGAVVARPRASAKPRARSRRRRKPKHRARVHAPAPPRTPAPPVAATPPPSASATLLPDGTAAPPPGAPAAVVAAIAAGNRIASLPYKWGGGHATWEDDGYDCSGSVGYALHGGGLLDATATSGDLMAYGEPGPGTWITIYTNPDHVYMVVAGLRFDTSGAHPSRWQTAPRSSDGFVVRHPAGL